MSTPNFLIIGTQKGGTSWLRNMLMQHPDVFLAPNEIHYFSNDNNFARGVDWYLRHFKGAGSASAVGEKSPGYMLLNRDDPLLVPRRIHEMLPNARLIALLRNPVERAISAINHNIRIGRIPVDADLNALIHDGINDANFIRYGYYHDCLQAYYQVFDPAQMKVMIYEDDIVAQPEQTLVKVCRFLGVDDSVPFNNLDKQVNASRLSNMGTRIINTLPAGNRIALRVLSRLERAAQVKAEKKRPDTATINFLYDLYTQENEKLFKLLGHEVKSWDRSQAYITR